MRIEICPWFLDICRIANMPCLSVTLSEINQSVGTMTTKLREHNDQSEENVSN